MVCMIMVVVCVVFKVIVVISVFEVIVMSQVIVHTVYSGHLGTQQNFPDYRGVLISVIYAHL